MKSSVMFMNESSIVFHSFYTTNIKDKSLKHILFEAKRHIIFRPKFLHLLSINSLNKSGETSSGEIHILRTSRHQTVRILSYIDIVHSS